MDLSEANQNFFICQRAIRGHRIHWRSSSRLKLTSIHAEGA